MTQPRRGVRKIVKFLAYGSVTAAAALTVAHFAWKYSGSNQWKLVQEKNGVKVYSMKVPGDTRERFKAVTRVKTTLNRVATAFNDTTTAGCRNFVPGCDAGPVLKAWDSASLNYIQYYQIKNPAPFSPRDLVIKTQMSRDPQTRGLVMEMTALPELVRRDACCVRMTQLQNRWRLTPLDNGTIELEFTQNDDPRIPYWLYNHVMPIGLTYLRRNVERVCNKAKYGKTEYAFLNQG